MLYDEPPPPIRTWRQKFGDAFRGVREGVRSQSSFTVHFGFAVAVLIAAALLTMSPIEWAVLVLCITLVLTAEMFNSALESMARAITGESNPHLGNALDIGSAAVLTAAAGASIVGAIVLGHRAGQLLGWW